jgi:hypothetical protein
MTYQEITGLCNQIRLATQDMQVIESDIAHVMKQLGGLRRRISERESQKEKAVAAIEKALQGCPPCIVVMWHERDPAIYWDGETGQVLPTVTPWSLSSDATGIGDDDEAV